MTHRVRFDPRAATEEQASVDWYENRRPGLGAEFATAIDDALHRICENAEGYPLWQDGQPFRKCTMRRFPYSLFYVLEQDAVVVLAVAHSRRRPGYWQQKDL
ncbi:MAG: type II toxin-antitoxin system RelE/ParE family toxin [Proteobacteria bacterium]|jgi:toxin ParE1/3/4|nr:type II toxin-antitoxin system RelE/ParE family toxin [Pseudomonadota bacterium]